MAYNSFIDEAWDRLAPTDIAQVDIGCVLTVNSGIECKGAGSHCCTVHMQEALAIRQLTSTFPPPTACHYPTTPIASQERRQPRNEPATTLHRLLCNTSSASEGSRLFSVPRDPSDAPRFQITPSAWSWPAPCSPPSQPAPSSSCGSGTGPRSRPFWLTVCARPCNLLCEGFD